MSKKKAKRTQELTLRQKAVNYLVKCSIPEPVKVKPVKDTRKPIQRELDAFFAQNPFGCNNRKVIQLAQIICGVSLQEPVKDREAVYTMHQVIVPVSNRESGHSYRLNEPCLIIDTARAVAMQFDGRTQNHLPQSQERFEQEISRPTPEQVEWFVNMMPQDVFDRTFGFLARI